MTHILKGLSFCYLIYGLTALSLALGRNMISGNIRSDTYKQFHQKLSLIETYFEILVSAKHSFSSNVEPNKIRYVFSVVMNTSTIWLSIMKIQSVCIPFSFLF